MGPGFPVQHDAQNEIAREHELVPRGSLDHLG